MRLRPVVFAAAMVMALTAPAQEDESRRYFSLSTEGPVRKGGTVPVRVSAQGVDTLEFRLYRVNDPVKFFEQLSDPHSAGRAARRRPKAVTPIEKFDQWRRETRAWMRDLVRAQFGAEERSAIRAWMNPPVKAPAWKCSTSGSAPARGLRPSTRSVSGGVPGTDSGCAGGKAVGVVVVEPRPSLLRPLVRRRHVGPPPVLPVHEVLPPVVPVRPSVWPLLPAAWRPRPRSLVPDADVPVVPSPSWPGGP